MQRFENQTIEEEQCPVQLGPKEWENSFRWSQNEALQDLEFLKCAFGGGLTTFGAPINRSRARNIRLKNCVTNSFSGHGAIFDEVFVDGLRVSVHPVFLLGCALRHVTLTGVCGRFIMSRDIDYNDEARSDTFNAANAAFYEDVDWALDISNVKAACLDIRGCIPSRLIRRNPDEQVVMTRSTALDGAWKNHDPPESFPIAVSIFLECGADDTVFIAGRRSKHFRRDAEYYHRLKAAGLVT